MFLLWLGILTQLNVLSYEPPLAINVGTDESPYTAPIVLIAELRSVPCGYEYAIYCVDESDCPHPKCFATGVYGFKTKEGLLEFLGQHVTCDSTIRVFGTDIPKCTEKVEKVQPPPQEVVKREWR